MVIMCVISFFIQVSVYTDDFTCDSEGTRLLAIMRLFAIVRLIARDAIIFYNRSRDYEIPQSPIPNVFNLSGLNCCLLLLGA